MRARFQSKLSIVMLGTLLLLLPVWTTALHSGVGGPQQFLDSDGNNVPIDDVSKEGCRCHAPDPDNAVTVVLDDVPYRYIPQQIYQFRLQLIGGPDIGGAYSAGFAMSVSEGALQSTDANTQNWEGNASTLTHTEAGAATSDRSWVFLWTAPDENTGPVTFWIAGNSVNGDQVPTDADRWNQLTLTLQEGDAQVGTQGTRTVFAGDGNVQPPEPPEEEGVDLEHMGAELRAHWLGLLGFGAVIVVIIFAGLLLRYGFSNTYEGRSNLLRLRYKHMRRGDQ